MYNNTMIKLVKKNWQKIFIFSSLLVLPVVSFAGEGDTPSNPALGGKIVNPIPNITSIPSLVQKILEGALKIGIPIVALAIIYCGFLFVAARGNSEKLTKAKDALLYTLIGAAILLGAWAIAKMISATVLSL
ncbi:pilin [Patescibacteria group bacterium]|nr:pilin [Patescibacteria group bacterium]